MARIADRLQENAPGDYFIDTSCIDCDTCRQLAPEVFARLAEKGQSVVKRQPETPSQRRRAAMAVVACPTASIGTASKADVRAALDAFPEAITTGSPLDVFYCGYTSESSFGASSYLVRRPEGNVLIDSPRAARPLLDRIAELGGVRFLFLTHRDDVADHAAIRARFGCERVMHASDIDSGTASVEIVIEGSEPTTIGGDLTVIPVAGHTRGSAALLVEDRYLFSGDHLWYDGTQGRLHASRHVCWYSWAEQTRSMERLLGFDFEWVFPGHGRRHQAPSAEAMRAEVRALVERMRGGLGC